MNSYVLICNPNRYDIIKCFKESDEVVWKNNRHCEVGDTVYIYVGRPYSGLLYLCEVTEVNVALPADMTYVENDSKKKSTYMKLNKQKDLLSYGIKLPELLANGLKTVQCATIASDELKSYIDNVLNR